MVAQPLLIALGTPVLEVLEGVPSIARAVIFMTTPSSSTGNAGLSE